jgi:hypothetical protein
MYTYEQSDQPSISNTTPTIIFKSCNQSSFNMELLVTSLIKFSKKICYSIPNSYIDRLFICTGYKLVKYYSLFIGYHQNEINQNQNNSLENTTICMYACFFFYSNAFSSLISLGAIHHGSWSIKFNCTISNNFTSHTSTKIH